MSSRSTHSASASALGTANSAAGYDRVLVHEDAVPDLPADLRSRAKRGDADIDITS